ncbi:MAG: hypothetical protein AAF288_12580 [Planctomycetota bacterium]
MAIVHERLRRKVREVWSELAGEHAVRLDHLHKGGASALRDALLTPDRKDKVAQDIAFHLTDWKDDAAFLLAVHLFPERFTKQEIAVGMSGFLVHAPNHVAAAAKLYGEPVSDVFAVGRLTVERGGLFGWIAQLGRALDALLPAREGGPPPEPDFQPGDRVVDTYGEQATVVAIDPEGNLGEGELIVKTDDGQEYAFRLDHSAFEKVGDAASKK